MFVMSNKCHHLLMVTIFMLLPLAMEWRIAVPWMAWIRCVTDTFGAQQKPLISKRIWILILTFFLCWSSPVLKWSLSLYVPQWRDLQQQQIDRINSYSILCGKCGPSKINNGVQSMSVNTCVYCIVLCLHNVHPLHIPWDVEGLYSSSCSWPRCVQRYMLWVIEHGLQLRCSKDHENIHC